MKKNASYEINFIEGKIILTKKFYKSASILNTPEYKELMALRNDNPGFTIELREIKKKEGKQSYRNLTYANMRNYIITLEGEESENLKEFDKVLKLSKVQTGPYAYVKTWFLKLYGDVFKSEEENSKNAEETSKTSELAMAQ